MKKTRLVALAAALCAGVAMPALAQRGPGPWDRIGSVDFSFRPDHEVAYGNFGGRVEALSFRARNGSVRCDSVTATFNNGRTREIYRGVLPVNRDIVVDLPGQSRMIRRIDFECRSMAPRISRVDIAADIGQYRAEWRRSPDWETRWSRMFNWDDGQFAYDPPPYAGDRYVAGPLDPAGWITVGTEVFDGPFAQETTVFGDGRPATSIGIRPINNDARCRYVTATFADGSSRRLPINAEENLDEGLVHNFNLGGYRDVTQIDMACQAADGGQVTMAVLAR